MPTPMDYTLMFWTPGHAPADDGATLGCATHGFAHARRWTKPDETAVATWASKLRGVALAGTYAQVLERVATTGVTPAFVLAFFTHSEGMEAFLSELRLRLPDVPVVGGGTARGPGQSRGQVRPAAEDVAVLLVTDNAWRAQTANIHTDTTIRARFRRGGPRVITHLQLGPDAPWQEAATAYRSLQARFAVPEANHESIALADPSGRNVHCFIAGAELHCGANLPAGDTLSVGLVTPPEAARRLADFASTPGTLVFGCAGLRGLLPAPLQPADGTLATFLFGEIVSPSGPCQFGNLMLAKLMPA